MHETKGTKGRGKMLYRQHVDAMVLGGRSARNTRRLARASFSGVFFSGLVLNIAQSPRKWQPEFAFLSLSVSEWKIKSCANWRNSNHGSNDSQPLPKKELFPVAKNLVQLFSLPFRRMAF